MLKVNVCHECCLVPFLSKIEEKHLPFGLMSEDLGLRIRQLKDKNICPKIFVSLRILGLRETLPMNHWIATSSSQAITFTSRNKIARGQANENMAARILRPQHVEQQKVTNISELISLIMSPITPMEEFHSRSVTWIDLADMFRRSSFCLGF